MFGLADHLEWVADPGKLFADAKKAGNKKKGHDPSGTQRDGTIAF
jgi:hypothetical protein